MAHAKDATATLFACVASPYIYSIVQGMWIAQSHRVAAGLIDETASPSAFLALFALDLPNVLLSATIVALLVAWTVRSRSVLSAAIVGSWTFAVVAFAELTAGHVHLPVSFVHGSEEARVMLLLQALCFPIATTLVARAALRSRRRAASA